MLPSHFQASLERGNGQQGEILLFFSVTHQVDVDELFHFHAFRHHVFDDRRKEVSSVFTLGNHLGETSKSTRAFDFSTYTDDATHGFQFQVVLIAVQHLLQIFVPEASRPYGLAHVRVDVTLLLIVER